MRTPPSPAATAAAGGTAASGTGALLLIAVWFGLLTGLLEVAIAAARKFVLHRFIFLSPHVVWMAPLTDVCLFVLIGLALVCAASRWPQRVSLRGAVLIFAGIGVMALLFIYGPLHRGAAVLLAAGVATQISAFVAARADGFVALVRRSLPGMLAVVVAGAAAVWGRQALAERQAFASLPAAPAHAPNVLLIVLDTVRARSLSLYGYQRATTPQLQRLALGGVRFEQALSTAPWTLPSHASMFTGRFPHELSTNWMAPLDDRSPTLAEIFHKHGYRTAGFAANILYCSYESGLTRGFAHYEDFPVSLQQIITSASLGRAIGGAPWMHRITGSYQFAARKTADALNRDFLAWLSIPSDRPFFAFLNYFDAHNPYIPPPPFDVQFGPKKPRRNPLLQPGWPWSAQDIAAERDAYEGSIAYLDSQLGALFDALRQRGALDDTLVVVTSDHGEEFGEHHVMGHGSSLYMPALHVPLLVLFPTHVPAGVSIEESVSLRDVAATILDLTHLATEEHLPGTSLARYWRAQADAEAALLSEVRQLPSVPVTYPVAKGDMRSLLLESRASSSQLTSRYHCIRNGDGREELYDTERDVEERRDLAGNPDAQPTLQRCRTALDRLVPPPT